MFAVENGLPKLGHHFLHVVCVIAEAFAERAVHAMGSPCPVRQFVEKGGIPTLGGGAGFGPVEAMTIRHCADFSGREIECAIPSDGEFCTRCSDERLGSVGWVDKVQGTALRGRHRVYDMRKSDHLAS